MDLPQAFRIVTEHVCPFGPSRLSLSIAKKLCNQDAQKINRLLWPPKFPARLSVFYTAT
jgi:hypothetical protein